VSTESAGQVRLGRTMGIAGLCALVPLVGNAITTLLTGSTGRASWLIVPAVGVSVAMVTAVIEAYGSAAHPQRPAKDDAQDLQPSTRRRPVRRETSLAFALIVAVLVFGLGGLAVSEGTRHVVIEAHATVSDGVSSISTRVSQAWYQRQVAATCNAVRRATKDFSIVPGPGQNVDLDATLTGARASFESATRRLQLLFDKSAPKRLRRKAKVARGRAKSYIREGRENLQALGARLPAYPTLEQLRAAGAPTSRSIDVVARLEAAMTDLAGRDCNLSSS
jgi:hypothetical protein